MAGNILRRSILIKVLVTFLLVVFPLYFLGILIYRQGLDTIREGIASSMKAREEFFMSTLGKDIEHIKALEYGLVIDNNLTRLAVIPQSLDDIGRYQAIVQLQQKLSSFISSSPIIGNIKVHMKLIDRTVSPRGVDPLDKDYFRKLFSAVSTSDSGLVFLEDRIFLKTVFPWPEFSDDRDVLFMVDIELSVPAVSESLSKIRDTYSGGVFLYSGSGEKIIASKSKGGIPGEVLDYVFSSGAAADGRSDSQVSVRVDGRPYLVVVTYSQNLDQGLCAFAPEAEIFARMRGHSLWFIVFSAMALSLIVLYSITTYKIIYEPLRVMVGAFRKLKEGDFSIRIDHRQSDEFKDLFEGFNEMTRELKDFIDKSYSQTILVQKAELRQLQSQINPHFLYNTFFMLYNIAKAEGSETTAELTRRLGTYYQFVTRSSADEVTLEREIEHAKIYADIQALRYSNRVRVDFAEAPPGLAELRVPRLILQPVIENAIEHGLKDKLEDARLSVAFARRGNTLELIVEDNGDGATENELEEICARIEAMDGEWGQSGHTALVNIHKRLRLRFGGGSGLRLERITGGGTRAVLAVELPPEFASAGEGL